MIVLPEPAALGVETDRRRDEITNAFWLEVLRQPVADEIGIAVIRVTQFPEEALCIIIVHAREQVIVVLVVCAEPIQPGEPVHLGMVELGDTDRHVVRQFRARRHAGHAALRHPEQRALEILVGITKRTLPDRVDEQQQSLAAGQVVHRVRRVRACFRGTVAEVEP